MLIDTHAHLNDERLLPEVEKIVKEMKSKNLEAIVNVGYDRKSSEISLELSEKYSTVYAVLGIHPHDSRLAAKEDYDFIGASALNSKVVGIGETGLDYFYDLSDRETQKRVFVEHLELADSLKLPVVIHLRDAYSDMYQLLKDNKKYLNNGAMLHCYSGSLEMLKLFLKFDSVYFSYGGAITFKNAQKEEIVLATPLDRLLVETDCPYMTPVPYRGKTNCPEYVNLVADKIKSWLPDKDIESITTANAKTLFKKII
jgi:TatD DNase family protein